MNIKNDIPAIELVAVSKSLAISKLIKISQFG